MGDLYRWDDEDQAKARRQLEERDREWTRRLHRCRCLQPLRDRKYFGRWACRLCGRLMRRPTGEFPPLER